MPLLLLLFLTLPCMVDNWPAPGDWVGGPLIVVGLTWLGVVVEVLLAAFDAFVPGTPVFA